MVWDQPLFDWAMGQEDLPLIWYLLEHGAAVDLNRRMTSLHQTPLQYVLRDDHLNLELAHYFLDQGADPSSPLSGREFAYDGHPQRFD